MKFTKMHGCGNDYVYINCFEETVDNPSELAVAMADRHFGIGGDGIVLILPSETSDFRMRMFNADGSEAQMCGNAIRCVGKYVYDNKMTDQETIDVETLAGVKILDMTIEDGKVTTVRVDMGQPIFTAKQIPVVAGVVNTELAAPRLNIGVENESFQFTCVSMGNPHTITFVDEITDKHIHRYGPEIEVDACFPEKTNVEFATIIDEKTIDMRVWERGTGETLACGTGACATHVAAVVNGHVGREAIIRLIGGELYIEWDEITNHVFMTGPAEVVFTGEWL